MVERPKVEGPEPSPFSPGDPLFPFPLFDTVDDRDPCVETDSGPNDAPPLPVSDIGDKSVPKFTSPETRSWSDVGKVS